MLNDAVNILSWLWDKLACLWPYVPLAVRPYQRAVMFRGGRTVILLEPGIHWRWRGLDQVETIHVRPEWIAVEEQSLTTTDGAEIIIRVAVNVEVIDPVKYYCEVDDWEHSVRNVVRAYVARRVRTWTLAETREHRAQLESGLRDTLVRKLALWGTVVHEVAVTDDVRARNYRVFTDGRSQLF